MYANKTIEIETHIDFSQQITYIKWGLVVDSGVLDVGVFKDSQLQKKNIERWKCYYIFVSNLPGVLADFLIHFHLEKQKMLE